MVGHFPVFQILLQIEIRMFIMTFPPAWTNSAGMLSTLADFLIFSALTARRIGYALHLVSADSQVLLGPQQSQSGKGLRSKYSATLLRISSSSVRHFPDLYVCRFTLLLCCQVLD